MPYVIPPMTAAVGATRATSYAKTGVHVDVGLAPLQLWEKHLYRRWDAQLAGSFEQIDHAVWGAALAGGPIFHPWGIGSSSGNLTRVMPQLVARLDTEGQSLGVRVVLERAGFVNGDTSGKDNAGGGYGEGALGFYVETSYQSSDEVRDDWHITAGLSLRVPLLAGIACCLK